MILAVGWSSRSDLSPQHPLASRMTHQIASTKVQAIANSQFPSESCRHPPEISCSNISCYLSTRESNGSEFILARPICIRTK